MQAVILTGTIAGFAHVVSGADHLIAMGPAAINKPQKALKNSFSWGLGHSSGVLLLAFLAIFIKDITPLNKFFNYCRIPSWNFTSNCWSICYKKFFSIKYPFASP